MRLHRNNTKYSHNTRYLISKNVRVASEFKKKVFLFIFQSLFSTHTCNHQWHGQTRSLLVLDLFLVTKNPVTIQRQYNSHYHTSSIQDPLRGMMSVRTCLDPCSIEPANVQWSPADCGSVYWEQNLKFQIRYINALWLLLICKFSAWFHQR